MNMSYITRLWMKLICIIGTSIPYDLELHFEKEIKMKIYMQNISFLLVDNGMHWFRSFFLYILEKSIQSAQQLTISSI